MFNLLHENEGLLKTRSLLDAGITDRQIRSAVTSRQLIRPRRGWIALPDAPPQLIAAVQRGTLLTCASAARHLGLWTFDPVQHHLAAPHPRSRVHPEGAVIHWARPLVPRRPGQLVDRLENVLALVAACQPRETALVVFESALNKGLTTLGALRQLPFAAPARDLLDSCTPYSDSGLETLFKSRFSWLQIPVRAQVWVLGHRVDMLIGARLVVQIDGGHHVGAQRDRDNLHDAKLQLAGYHVLRFSYRQIIDRWEEVHDAVIGAVSRGLHLK